MKNPKELKEIAKNQRFLRDRPEPQGRPASVQQLPQQTRPVNSDPDAERYDQTPPAPQAQPKRSGPGPSD
ncbi:MAG TPA: hypothetical protein VJP40_04020 [bacterium]|nr:hypothetical protein [bacterium]